MIKFMTWFKNVGLNLINSEKPLSDLYNAVSPCSSKALTSTSVWYLLSSTNLVHSALTKYFSNAEGVVTYTGTQTVKVKFAGSAFVETSKACKLTFQIYVNDVVVAGGSTTRDITASAKISGMDIVKILELEAGDIVTVKANSDTNNTDLTVHNINLVITTV